MEKINPLQTFDVFDTDIRRMQTIYLNSIGFDFEEIKKWTGYAISTIKSYIYKFDYLLAEAQKIFSKITQKAKLEIIGKRERVYLFKFYKADDSLICSKVGTTTRLPEQRLKEEIKYYQEHGIEVNRAEICSVIDCNGLPAEGAESFTRAMYIRKNPTAFCKNDRFFGVDISTKSFIKYVNSYLGEANLA